MNEVRDVSQEEQELIEATRAWESAECMNCGSRFATEQAAIEHNSPECYWSVVHSYGAKAVN